MPGVSASTVAFPWVSFPQLEEQPTIGNMLVVTTTRIDVFALASDASLWHICQTAPNDGWSAWESLGAPPPGIQINASIGGGDTGQIQVFVVGVDGNIWTIWEPYNAASQWSGWTSLPGLPSGPCNSYMAFAESPAGINLQAVFAVGLNDGKLWVAQNDRTGPAGWSQWFSLGYPGAQPPSNPMNFCVGSNQDGRLEVFALDYQANPWHVFVLPVWDSSSNWQSYARTGADASSGWSAWVPLPVPAGNPQPSLGGSPGPGYGALTSSQDSSGRLEYYVADSAGIVWGVSQLVVNTLNSWSAWQSMPPVGQGFLSGGAGGQITGATLAAALNQDGSEELFAIDARGTIWHIFNDTPGGSGLWAQWGASNR
jgi:hypothetical protein